MVALAKHKTISAPFGNEVAEYRFEYDFAEDGGATGVLDIMTAGEALIVESVHTRVLAACTSTGSATVKAGVTGDDDRVMNTTQGAVASLTLDAVVLPVVVEGTPNVVAFPVVLASGAKLLQTIATEVLSAGKIQYVVRVRKP